MNLPKSLATRLRIHLSGDSRSRAAVSDSLEIVEAVINDVEGDIMTDKGLPSDQKGNLAMILAQIRQGLISAKNSLSAPAHEPRSNNEKRLHGTHLI